MAVVTNNGYVDNALRLYNKKDSAYIILGRSQTPWSDETKPDTEDPTATRIQEVQGLRKVTTASVCRVLADGEAALNPTISYGGTTWELVGADEAFITQASYVYFGALIDVNDFPGGTYRQVGLVTDVIPNAGINVSALTPDEVSDFGTLQMYQNTVPYNRTNTKVLEQFIIDCKGVN